VRPRKARCSLFVRRLALRSQRVVADGLRGWVDSDCERRRHAGELLFERRGQEEGSWSSSSMGRARERAAWLKSLMLSLLGPALTGSCDAGFEELVSLGERVGFVPADAMQCKAREVMCNQIQGIATVERSVGARMTAHGALASFLSTSDTLGSGLEGVADVGERLLIFGAISPGSDSLEPISLSRHVMRLIP
jgi:hypothetical protein